MRDESSAAPSPDMTRETSRRRLLAWMGAGGAAAFAALFSRGEAHAGHDGTNVLHLGEGNGAPPGRKTGIASNVDAFSVDVVNFNTGTAGGLHARSFGQFPAIQAHGHGPSFAGVFGVSASASSDFDGGSGDGVRGLSAHGTGVRGSSQTGTGGAFSSESGAALVVTGRASMTAEVPAAEGDTLFVENTGTGAAGGGAISATASGDESHAVEGLANGLGVGVRGVAGGDPWGEGPGDGVHGTTGSGIGVLGNTNGAGIGVEARAENPGGLALQVRGSARFSTAGSAQIPAGVDAVFVANDAVTEESHISVTVTENPSGRQITWVERNPGAGFTVHTSKKTPGTNVTYLIVDPYE